METVVTGPGSPVGGGSCALAGRTLIEEQIRVRREAFGKKERQILEEKSRQARLVRIMSAALAHGPLFTQVP